MCDDEGSCASEAQVVVDHIKARRVFILGLGAPSTYRCGRCGYWHHGSAALELPAISMKNNARHAASPLRHLPARSWAPSSSVLVLTGARQPADLYCDMSVTAMSQTCHRLLARRVKRT